jgi:hypothetical protein
MLISHDLLGPRSFLSIMEAAGIVLSELPMPGWQLGRPGRQLIRRYSYESPRTQQTVFVLSCTQHLPAAGTQHQVWQFDHEFSEAEALALLAQQRAPYSEV